MGWFINFLSFQKVILTNQQHERPEILRNVCLILLKVPPHMTKENKWIQNTVLLKGTASTEVTVSGIK